MWISENTVKTKHALLIFFLISFSSYAFASDPTPLFVIFIAFPLIGLGVIFCLISVFAPKGGLVTGIILLLVHILILPWTSGAGYMDSAGGWMALSFIINVSVILIALVRQKKIRIKANT